MKNLYLIVLIFLCFAQVVFSQTPISPNCTVDTVGLASFLNSINLNEDEPLAFELPSANSTFAVMHGFIDGSTPSVVQNFIDSYPSVTTLVFMQMPGSDNDDANLEASQLLRNRGYTTYLPAVTAYNQDAFIASGAVDMFLAGTRRVIDENAEVGVHSWSDGTNEATDYPVGHAFHQAYIDYYVAMGFSQTDAEAFYYFTINAAPANGIHNMTEEELEQYKLRTCKFGPAQNNIDLNSLPDVADYTVIQTNPSADTVIIGLHGGPTDMLEVGDFEFFENIPTFSVVEMQQKQHYSPEILANSTMTLDEAIIYNDTTIAMLRKVVNHYNNLNKTVVLIGHSFGAFLLTEYLDDYGIDDVHRVIPMAGRLNMNQEVVDAFATGYSAYFIDGVMVQVESQQSPPEELAAMKLQAGIGYNRFVDSLAMLDLTKLMYVSGTQDEAVGRLLPDELLMLENTNASILTVQNGNHDSPFFDPQMTAVLDFIRGGAIVGVFENSLAQADVKMFPTIVENELTINAEKRGELKLTSLNGQVLFQRELVSFSNQVNLSGLPKGLYIATYQTIDNEWASEKLILR